MTRRLLPIMLSMANQIVVVIGGGKVATKRVTALIEVAGDITVISPAATSEIKAWHAQKCLVWRQKQFEGPDIAHATMVIAATNSASVNRQVAANATSVQLLSVADETGAGNFFIPAAIRRGALQIAVSTGGASPGLAQRIRAELAAVYDEKYVEYVRFLERARSLVRQSRVGAAAGRQVLAALLRVEYLDLPSSQRDALLNELLAKAVNPEGN